MKKLSIVAREHAKNKRLARVLIAFIAIAIAFCLGFAMSSNPAVTAALGIGASNTKNVASNTTTKSVYNDLSTRIDEVENILSTYSMDSIDLQNATAKMLGELVKTIDDPYAEYFNSERYETYIKETADKNYSGIGVLFGDYNGRAYAIDVLDGSEAQAKGVTQGDFVEAIDGDASHKWGILDVIGSLARDDGESVIITWMRPISLDADKGSEFTTTLECKDYVAQNVSTAMYEQVGYIRIAQFTDNCASLVESAVGDLAGQGATSFVIDVRDNPGGYLTQSLDCASLFIQSGVLVGIETNEGVNTRTASGNTISTSPIVVLMNQYTCAAGEVFAAAMKDNQRATAIGQTTMGKGSVQVIRELTFGGAIRYTAAYYLTPAGQAINGVGIVPDIAVAADAADPENDNQLVVAIDAARSLVQQ